MNPNNLQTRQANEVTVAAVPAEYRHLHQGDHIRSDRLPPLPVGVFTAPMQMLTTPEPIKPQHRQ